MLRSFFSQNRYAAGQGFVEYGVLVILLFILIIGLISVVQGKTSGVFSQIDSTLVP